VFKTINSKKGATLVLW